MGQEGGKPLEFIWIPVKDLGTIDMRPRFIAKEILSLGTGIKHIINKEIPTRD
jgi:hypothetical protein